MSHETIQTLANSLSSKLGPLLCGDAATTTELGELEAILSDELEATVGHAVRLVPQLRRTRPYTMLYFLSRSRLLINQLLFWYGGQFATGLHDDHKSDIYCALLDAYQVAGLLSEQQAADLRWSRTVLLDVMERAATMQTLS